MTDAYLEADSLLGACGRMLSAGKIQREGQDVVWNGNVCVKSLGKIWFGDIDLIGSNDDLTQLATKLGEPVYVLREMDARFNNEKKPLYDQARAVFHPVPE